jgi:hypothetical protein
LTWTRTFQSYRIFLTGLAFHFASVAKIPQEAHANTLYWSRKNKNAPRNVSSLFASNVDMDTCASRLLPSLEVRREEFRQMVVKGLVEKKKSVARRE